MTETRPDTADVQTLYAARLAGFRWYAASPVMGFIVRATISIALAALAATLPVAFARGYPLPLLLLLPPIFLGVYVAGPMIGVQNWRRAVGRLREAGVIDELRLTEGSAAPLILHLERLALARGYGWLAGFAAFPAFIALGVLVIFIWTVQPDPEELRMFVWGTAIMLAATGSCVWLHAIWGHLVMRRLANRVLADLPAKARRGRLLLGSLAVSALPAAVSIFATVMVVRGLQRMRPRLGNDLLELVIFMGVAPLLEFIILLFVLMWRQEHGPLRLELETDEE